MSKKLLTGDEAVARGAYEAGVSYASAYPGTPSTEILENLSTYPEIYAEWAPNEKVALESAIGASVAGQRSMMSMKHVGMNVAADPMFTWAYMGVNAGNLIVTADEPGMFSSQNEQDNRNYAKAAKLAMLEPSDSQECIDISGCCFQSLVTDLCNIISEFLVLGYEVRLRVDFHCNSLFLIVGDFQHDNAFRRNTSGFFLSGGFAVLTQIFDRFFKIAVRLAKGFFAVHHSGAGKFTQFFNLCSCNCHNYSSSPARAASAAASAASSSPVSCAAPCFASITALAIVDTSSLTARIASSLPGMT